jgi:4'-phosphopantetheinyl transferase
MSSGPAALPEDAVDAPLLDRDSVEVRWLVVDQIEPDHWDRLEGMLDETERAQAGRFQFERDRNSYVAAHALTRIMLSAHAPHPPWAWRFSIGGHGRPEIIRLPGIPPLRFNLSHTRGLVAAAVTLDNDVGIDVEVVDATRLTMNLASHYFSASEMDYLRRVPVDQRPEAMFAFWTLKEAYIKAVGLGLSLSLDAFSYELEPLSIRFSPPLDDNPASWLLRRLKPTSDHALAFALRHPAPRTVRVCAEAIDPSHLTALADYARKRFGTSPSR